MTLLKIFLGSAELKRRIVARSIEFNIPLRYVCNEVLVDYSRFMAAYINSSNISDLDITEQQVEQLLKLLGIETRVQFIINANYNGAEVRERLKEKHELRIKKHLYYDTKKEERDPAAS